MSAVLDPNQAPIDGARPRDKRWVRIPLLITLAVVAGVLTVRFAVQMFAPHLYAGTVLQGDAPAPGMDGLFYPTGEEVDLANFGDDLVMIYFGYTNCPDVCPTTLSTAARAMNELPADLAERTNLLMVSVDPDRDDTDYLRDYMSFFHPKFVGATGATDAVDRVASRYGIFYELGSGADYTVDHTATVMAIAPDGVLRIVWPPDVTSDQLAADIQELLS